MIGYLQDKHASDDFIKELLEMSCIKAELQNVYAAEASAPADANTVENKEVSVASEATIDEGLQNADMSQEKRQALKALLLADQNTL